MTVPVNLETQVQFLKSVGPARARALARLGIMTVGELLTHFPRRYFDRSACCAMRALTGGREATVQGEVLTSGQRRTRRGGSIQTVTVGDETGVVFCVWFNQPHILKQFRTGVKVMASGVPQRHQDRWQLVHPDYEILDKQHEEAEGVPLPLHTGRMVPVYGLTAGIGQHWLRSLVHQALVRVGATLPETLTTEILAGRQLVSRQDALAQIHFPADARSLAAARRRLVYEELFLVQVLMGLRRVGRQQEAGLRLDKPGDLTARLVSSLPFALTGAQRRVLSEILADMRSGKPMHRLLQGDVGSGKTLVAFIAALFVIEQGHQGLLLAPTEVLAHQHGRVLRELAEPLGVTVETLTGSTSAASRRAVLKGVAEGGIDLLVGTHAVIQDDVFIPHLGLSVVDEQHRFGVRQRGRTTSTGGGPLPHVLVMSATPIPRSLALTLYGDLDLSLIDELPGGRQPIVTRIAKAEEESGMWAACLKEVAAGHQAYVIYPVIEETEGSDLKAAVAEHERLAAEVFPGIRVGLLHGRMKGREKDAVMMEFRAGVIQVLVATTVIEVGVDVPNATFMAIHHPERFGLAQLHQLRGRIGRGSGASTCWLLCDRFVGHESYERIRFFASHTDGFDLAEQDLRQRGPGDAWGVRQHGAPGFRLANPLRDRELVGLCRDDAQSLLASDPDLRQPASGPVREALLESYSRLEPFRAG